MSSSNNRNQSGAASSNYNNNNNNNNDNNNTHCTTMMNPNGHLDNIGNHVPKSTFKPSGRNNIGNPTTSTTHTTPTVLAQPSPNPNRLSMSSSNRPLVDNNNIHNNTFTPTTNNSLVHNNKNNNTYNSDDTGSSYRSRNTTTTNNNKSNKRICTPIPNTNLSSHNDYNTSRSQQQHNPIFKSSSNSFQDLGSPTEDLPPQQQPSARNSSQIPSSSSTQCQQQPQRTITPPTWIYEGVPEVNTNIPPLGTYPLDIFSYRQQCLENEFKLRFPNAPNDIPIHRIRLPQPPNIKIEAINGKWQKFFNLACDPCVLETVTKGRSDASSRLKTMINNTFSIQASAITSLNLYMALKALNNNVSPIQSPQPCETTSLFTTSIDKDNVYSISTPSILTPMVSPSDVLSTLVSPGDFGVDSVPYGQGGNDSPISIVLSPATPHFSHGSSHNNNGSLLLSLAPPQINKRRNGSSSTRGADGDDVDDGDDGDDGDLGAIVSITSRGGVVSGGGNGISSDSNSNATPSNSQHISHFGSMMYPTSDQDQFPFVLPYFKMFEPAVLLAQRKSKLLGLDDYLMKMMHGMNMLATIYYDTLVPFSDNNNNIRSLVKKRQMLDQYELERAIEREKCQQLLIENDGLAAVDEHKDTLISAATSSLPTTVASDLPFLEGDLTMDDAQSTTNNSKSRTPKKTSVRPSRDENLNANSFMCTSSAGVNSWCGFTNMGINQLLGGQGYIDLDSVIRDYDPTQSIRLVNPENPSQYVDYTPPWWYISFLNDLQNLLLNLLYARQRAPKYGPIHAEVRSFIKTHSIRSGRIEDAILLLYRQAYINYIAQTSPFGSDTALDYGELACGDNVSLQYDLLNCLSRNHKHYELQYFILLFSDEFKYPNSHHHFAPMAVNVKAYFHSFPRNALNLPENQSREIRAHRGALADPHKYYHIPTTYKSIYIDSDCHFIDMFLYIRSVFEIRGLPTTFFDPIFQALGGLLQNKRPLSNLFNTLRTHSDPLPQGTPPNDLDIPAIFQYTNHDVNFVPQVHNVQHFNDALKSRGYSAYRDFLAKNYDLTIDRVNNWTIPPLGEMVICGFDTEFSSFDLPALVMFTSPHRPVSLFQITFGDYTFLVPRAILTPLDIKNPISNHPNIASQLTILTPLDRLLSFVAICKSLFYSPNVGITGVSVEEDVSHSCSTLNILLDDVRPNSPSNLFQINMTNNVDLYDILIQSLLDINSPKPPKAPQPPLYRLHIMSDKCISTLDINTPLFHWGVALLAQSILKEQQMTNKNPPNDGLAGVTLQDGKNNSNITSTFDDDDENPDQTSKDNLPTRLQFLSQHIRQRFPTVSKSILKDLFQNPRPQRYSLAKLTTMTWPSVTLFKDPVTTSNWERVPLREEQLEYAALDAYIALQLLQENYRKCVVKYQIIFPDDARRILIENLSGPKKQTFAKNGLGEAPSDE